MPCSFDFDPIHKILRIQMEGTLSKTAITEYYRLLRLHDEAIKPRAGILDLSGITSVDLTSRSISELAVLPPAFSDESRPRFVVAPSDHVYGMSRMFQSLGEKTRPNLHVVRSLEDAYSALGISDPHFEPLTLEYPDSGKA